METTVETLDQKIARIRAENAKAAQRFKEVEEDRKLAEQQGATVIKPLSVKKNDLKDGEKKDRKGLERDMPKGRRYTEKNDLKDGEKKDRKGLERDMPKGRRYTEKNDLKDGEKKDRKGLERDMPKGRRYTEKNDWKDGEENGRKGTERDMPKGRRYTAQNDWTKLREINNRKRLEREMKKNDWWTKEREINDYKRLERERKTLEEMEARGAIEKKGGLKAQREQEEKNRKGYSRKTKST